MIARIHLHSLALSEHPLAGILAVWIFLSRKRKD